MTFHEAVVVFGHGLALSAAAGLVIIVLIMPRRGALNGWYAAWVLLLAGWAFFGLARVTPGISPLSETYNFYLMVTGALLLPLALWAYASAAYRPQSYWEPPLRIGVVGLAAALLVLIWRGTLFEYHDSGDRLRLDVPAWGYGLIVLAALYAVRAAWTGQARGRRTFAAAALLVAAGVLTVAVRPLFALPVGTVLGAVAAVLVGGLLLQRQVFAPLEQAQARLDEVSAELRASHGQRDAEKARLAELQQELRDANRYKSEFLDGMGHSLRTPLNSIVGYSELMGKGIYGEMTPKQADRVDKIHRNSLDLLGLINDVLDLGKLEGGRLELHLSEVRVAAMAEALVDQLQAERPDAAVKLELDLDKPLRLIRVDELRIRQVLLNLLHHALRTTSAGYVRLAARSITVKDGRSDEFTLPVQGWLEDRHWLIVSVEDTGPGIPPEDQAVIFDAFRLRTTADAEDGAGLGLSIARRLVEIHAGRIWLTSRPGEGSTFFVALPALVAFDIADEVTLSRDELREARAIVLLIEDDELAADRLTAALQIGGFHAVRATDGPTGLARAHEVHPAAVVIDVLMPDTGGWDAIRRLKEDLDTADLPIVLTNGRAPVGSEPRALALGPSAYLRTPIQHDELLATLAHVQRAELEHPVLVVDNDPADRKTLRQFLTSENMTPHLCEDAQTALDWLAQGGVQPGLALLDVSMPGIGGFEVVARLRSDPALVGVPVVLTCAEHLRASDRAQLQASLARAFDEGAKCDDLVACVEQALA